MFKTLHKGLLAAVFASLPLAALAEGSVALEDVAKISVLPGWRTQDGSHMAAFRIQLAPGWKTYWRAPGDAGIPPQFGWKGSRNLKSVEFHWPTPSVHDQNGMRSIGYEGDVIIPVELTPNSADGPDIRLRGQMELGVCHDVCIPVSAKFDAELGRSEVKTPAIVASLKDHPLPAKQAGVETVTCSIEPISDGLRLTAVIALPKLGPDEITVVEFADQTTWVSPAETERQGRNLIVVSDLVPTSGKPFLLQRSDLRFTVLGRDRAVDIHGCQAG